MHCCFYWCPVIFVICLQFYFSWGSAVVSVFLLCFYWTFYQTCCINPFANVSFLSVILLKIIPNCFLFSVIAMVDNGTKKDFAGEEFASPGITRAKTTLLNRLFYSDTGGVLTGVLFVVTKLFFLFSALLVVAAVLGFVGVYLRKAYF